MATYFTTVDETRGYVKGWLEEWSGEFDVEWLADRMFAYHREEDRQTGRVSREGFVRILLDDDELDDILGMAELNTILKESGEVVRDGVHA